MGLHIRTTMVLLAIGAASLASAQKTPATLEMNAEGEIQIAADGHVSDYRLRSQLAPAVATLVDRSVRGWHFEPVVVDGAAVVAKTTMHLALRAEPVPGSGDYRLRIASIRFGEMKRTAHFVPPKYPVEAVRAHVGGKAIVAVRVDESGNVVEALPYQTSLDAHTRDEADAEHFRRVLEKASLEAARQWHYDVTDTLNGKPMGTQALVPISYFLCSSRNCSDPDRDGRWRALVPGPVQLVPWMHERLAVGQSLSTLGDDEAMPIDSPFHLKDDPVGKLL